MPYDFRKSDNELRLVDTGSVVRFRSLDNPERLIGPNLAWAGLDELTYSKEDAWRRVIARVRHKQARKLGVCAVWTPKGFDWVYGRFVGPDRNEQYEAYLAKPGENAEGLRPGYYEDLKTDYDERFYRQEVLGEYLSVFAGQVYHAFDRAENVRRLDFDRRHPLVWSLDFNVDPMASVIGQIVGNELRILEEIVLPNSNTPEACRVFGERMSKYLDEARTGIAGHVEVPVRVYGDSTGRRRQTSAGADSSDWRLVRDWFAEHAADHPMDFMVPSVNPPVKFRVHSTNALLRNAQGVRRLFIDPSCRELIADYEQVAWKADAAGNSIGDIDKVKNPKRTHVSDAAGYVIAREFGLRTYGGIGTEMVL